MTTFDAAETFRGLESLDWDFAEAPAVDPLHALHPYPAKFIPEVPRALIERLTRPGDLVLDPFSGGGTTAVEALRAGRRFHGIDANPLAAHITRVKSSSVSAADLAQIHHLAERATKSSETADSAWAPQIPNQDKWYAPDVFEALVALRALTMQRTSGVAQELSMLIFANCAAKASYQESETRYVSKPRLIRVDSVRAQFARELLRASDVLAAANWPKHDAKVLEGDARDGSNYPTGVAAAITSPPYPNAFDYHLYHRFRLFWLGPGPQSLRRMEIGSHLKHQSEKQPAQTYLTDMRAVLERTFESLAGGGWFSLVVGDGLYKGEIFRTASELESVGVDLGFEAYPPITRKLPVHRRSVAAVGRRLAEEQILVLRKPEANVSVVLEGPRYALFPYERTLRERELRLATASEVLESDRTDALHVTVPARKLQKLRRMAFSSSVKFDDGQPIPTQSGLLEGPDEGGRKKNSTYLSHGIHRYKGKFYPQLAKSLINASALEQDQIVLDPFGGSGTVALEATLAGIDAVSMDCNPVAASTARAKTDILHIEADRVRAFLRSIIRMTDDHLQHGRELEEFPSHLVDELASWFPIPVLAKLNTALSLVRSADDERLANLGQVLISDIIREVSQQEPKDLRIRRRAVSISDAPVLELLAGRAQTLLEKYQKFATLARPQLPRPGRAEIVFGDSTQADDFVHIQANALVSSPPYASALPYIDTDRLSIAAVYGFDMRARKPLESTMVGSREIANRERIQIETLLADPKALDLPSSTTAWLTAYLEAVQQDPNAGFRRRQAPAVLTRYFQSMAAVLANARTHLAADADVWLVLGNSKSTIAGTKWNIPTVEEVLAIAKHHGYEWVESIPISVTREDRLHSRHAIVENQILHLKSGR